jgi:tetratricopeptide (TPR) repeat protein
VLLWGTSPILFMQRNIPAKIKTTLKTKIILIISGIFLFLVLLEAGLRAGGAVLSSVQEYRNRQSIKQRGVYRILCLGESTTARQYPQQLEKVLNQSKAGVRFSVIDKGIPGTVTTVILSRVESFLDEYHPDLVVAMMGINDSGGHIPFEAATASKTTLFLKSFKIYKLSKLLWLHILVKAQEKDYACLTEIDLKDLPADSVLTYDSLKKALAVNPQDDDAYAGLGELCRIQARFPQAEALFKKALEINPKNYKAHVGLGSIYRISGKFPQAVEFFKEAIGINPKNFSAYAGLGLIYRVQEKLDLVEELFKKAIANIPECDNAYVGLGWIYALQRKLPQAEESLKKALAINPENFNAYDRLGKLYYYQEKFIQALEIFNKAAALKPKNDSILGSIVLLYEKTGNQELAKECGEKLNKLRSKYYKPVTVNNYRKLKEILDKRGIRLVCVQYPMRSVNLLKKVFEEENDAIFVDNEAVFKEMGRKVGLKEIFNDLFAGDFGHCTRKGNQLLAENIAKAVLREVFNK